MVVHCGSAKVKTEGEVTAEVEFLGKTGTKGDNLVVSVLPFEFGCSCIGGILGHSPVEGTTGIEVCVVNAVGFVAAPPVGEVYHNVEARADVVGFRFGVALDIIFPRTCADTFVVRLYETLYRHEVSTETGTQDGREPFTDVKRSGGSETVAEFAFFVN